MGLYFNESTNHLIVGSDPALDKAGDFSLSFGFKLDDNVGSSVQRLFMRTGSGIDYYLLELREAGHATQPNTLCFYAKDAAGKQVGALVSDDTPGQSTAWQTYCLIRSGDTFTQYIDGVANGTQTVAGFGALDPDGDLYLGCSPWGGSYFGGSLDEIAELHRALTLDEIRSLKYLPPSALPKDLAWYLPGLADVKEHWAGLSVTDNSGGLVEHPPGLFLPGPPRYVTWPPAVLRRSIFDSLVFRSPVVQAG